MPDRMRIAAAAEAVAAAIGARDVQTLRGLLAPGFTHRTHGGEAAGAETFLAGIAAIPGEIIFVRLEDLRIDLTPTGVLVTGFQHAQVRIDGQTIDDRRGFIDWFVDVSGEWKIQAAVDLPAPSTHAL
jgi:hypothetical protein